MLVNTKKVHPKKQLLIRIAVIFLIIAFLLAVFRCSHIIVKIGDKYHFVFSQELKLNDEDNANNSNVNEIIYMKQLKTLVISGTKITNVEFISEFNQLEVLIVACELEYAVDNVDSLKNCKKLSYVWLVNVYMENLDMFSELTNITSLEIFPAYSKITDISGLKNLDKLNFLRIFSTDCNDYSVLFELPNLNYLEIDKGELTEDEINRLEKKGVTVSES